MRRRIAVVALVAALLWGASPGAAEEPPFTREQDVVLGPEMSQTFLEIASEFHRRTGNRLHVTSGTRSPSEQADAMFEKLSRGERLTTLYRDYEAAAEITAAYRRHRRGGRRVAVREMARVIREQIARGRFISLHLTANAVDVRSRNLSRREQQVFRDVVSAVGGVELLQEGVPPHFHLQMR